MVLLGILFSTEVNTVNTDFLTRPLVSGILFSTVFNAVFVAKLATSGILFSISVILALQSVFLITSFFTTSLSLLKSTRTGTNLSISNLSTSAFKLATFAFNAKRDVSTCEIFLMSAFFA